MDENTWRELKREIGDQLNRDVRARVLIPEWKAFEQKVYEDPGFRLDDNLGDEPYVLRCYRGEYVRLRQTLFSDMYEFGSIDQGYGFNSSDFECIRCGSTKLFYNQIKEHFYCPCDH